MKTTQITTGNYIKYNGTWFKVGEFDTKTNSFNISNERGSTFIFPEEESRVEDSAKNFTEYYTNVSKW